MAEAAGAARATAVLETWFGAPGTPDHDRRRAVWFAAAPGFDALLRARFVADYRRAAAGAYDSWIAQRDAALALVLLLDQLPRNLFRGTAQAFATDAKAREIARAAVARGFDQELATVRRVFFYLPFEHSEALADQALSLRLFTALTAGDAAGDWLQYARRHHAVIARFGRFPHRNSALGRVSTPEEQAFLREPGSAF